MRGAATLTGASDTILSTGAGRQRTSKIFVLRRPCIASAAAIGRIISIASLETWL